MSELSHYNSYCTTILYLRVVLEKLSAAEIITDLRGIIKGSFNISPYEFESSDQRNF